jgi:hypothetical protein
MVMSIYSRLVTDQVTVAGVTATIRKLAPKHLDAAAEAAQLAAVEKAKRMRAAMGDDLSQMFASVKPAEMAAVTQADPLNGYDRVTLMRHAILSWTLPDLDPTPEVLEELDDDAQTRFATAILRLAKPSLFQTVEAQEDARKNA